MPIEQHQEDLADFYRSITLDNPLWRAEEKRAADVGKLALEKVKIGARLNIDPEPKPPTTVINIQQVFPDGTVATQRAAVEAGTE